MVILRSQNKNTDFLMIYLYCVAHYPFPSYFQLTENLMKPFMNHVCHDIRDSAREIHNELLVFASEQ